MRIGEARQTALKNMATRVDAPELSSFVRAVVQADQLGISLGRILRVQAADSRVRRQTAAEEKAMKARIKMMIPTVLFILPAMFIVLLGPRDPECDESPEVTPPETEKGFGSGLRAFDRAETR